MRIKKGDTVQVLSGNDKGKKEACYNVTLNVWSCNEGAMKFYEKCGLKPQKVGMEIIL